MSFSSLLNLTTGKCVKQKKLAQAETETKIATATSPWLNECTNKHLMRAMLVRRYFLTISTTVSAAGTTPTTSIQTVRERFSFETTRNVGKLSEGDGVVGSVVVHRTDVPHFHFDSNAFNSPWLVVVLVGHVDDPLNNLFIN